MNRPDTLAVSIIFVHNEIGVIQDIKGISQICKDKKVFLHTDAAQAVGNNLNVYLYITINRKNPYRCQGYGY